MTLNVSRPSSVCEQRYSGSLNNDTHSQLDKDSKSGKQFDSCLLEEKYCVMSSLAPAFLGLCKTGHWCPKRNTLRRPHDPLVASEDHNLDLRPQCPLQDREEEGHLGKTSGYKDSRSQ